MSYSKVLLFVIAMLSLFLVACTGDGNDLLAEIESRGTVRVSTDPNYAPQSILQEDGTFAGFDIDVAKEIANRLGVEVEFVVADRDALVAGSWEDQWDMSVGSLTVTTDRQEVLDFVEPAYYYTLAQFGAAAGSGIETLADINGQAVCVGAVSTYRLWLDGGFEAVGLPATSFYADPPGGVTTVPLNTGNECVQAIAAGGADFEVFLTGSTVIESAMAGGLPVYKVGTPVFSENLAVAFDKSSSLDNVRLVERVGEIITEMRADGTLRELSLQWFDVDLTQDPTE